MTNTPAAPAVPAATPDDRRTPISPSQLSWLQGELTSWQAAGLVDAGQAAAITGRYRPTNKLSLAKLLSTLGAAFVGFGLIWLVAANLDQLPPLLRFVVVTVFWLGFLATAEFLASRREHGGAIPSPVVGAVRILAALTFGAVIFQAAQSLQVPAFEPRLVGYWGLGALLYAYAVRSVGPLVIGVVAASAWFVSEVVVDQVSGLGVVLALLVAAVFAISLAAVQERWDPSFSVPWREIGVVLLLIGLFAAAVPSVDSEDFLWTPALIVGVILAAVAAAVGIAFGCGRARLEPAGALLFSGIAIGLVLWEAGNDSSRVDAQAWLHAGVSVAAYVAAAAGVAVMGLLRDSGRLTAAALIALVIFTTFQSFAVFAQIIQGAWLFVVLGVIFLATGYLFDRARRQLAATLQGEEL
jgi:uncharacterized membrane protein